MPLGQLSLKGRALRLLSGREHSRLELERRLAPFEQEPGQCARILDELQVKGFISEQRVAESIVNRRASRLGTARIRRELKDKGLEAGLVEEALGPLQASELARAREVWRRKFGDAGKTPADRARQMRFLAARGFAAEAIRKVLSGKEDLAEQDSIAG